MNIKRMIATALCACLCVSALTVTSGCNNPQTAEDSSVSLPSASTTQPEETTPDSEGASSKQNDSSTTTSSKEETESTDSSPDSSENSSDETQSSKPDETQSSKPDETQSSKPDETESGKPDEQTESSVNSQTSDSQASGSESSAAPQTSTPEVSSAVPPVQITEEEEAEIGTKSIEEFKETAQSEESTSDKTKLEQYLTDLLAKDETHFIITQYGLSAPSSTKPDYFQTVELQQKSNEAVYLNMGVTVFGSTLNYSYLTKDGKEYVIDHQKKTITVTNADSTDSLGEGDVSDLLTQYADVLEDSGTVTYDGKEMQYEQFEYKNGSSVSHLIVYYYEGEIYKIEVYQDKNGKLSLTGYITIQSDLPIDPSLYELPADYTISDTTD